MNKKILALSIAALVGSASVSAATVYEADGYTFGVKGDIEVNYTKAVGNDTEAKLGLDDADFGFTASSQINEDVTIFGEAMFDGGEKTGEARKTGIDNVFVGASYDIWTVKVGRHANFADEFGVSTDEEIGGLYTARDAWGDNSVIVDKTDQVITLNFATETIYGGVGLTQNEDGSKGGDDLQQYELKLGAKAGMFDVVGIYVDAEQGEGAAKQDAKSYILEGTVSLDAVTLAAHYAKAEQGKQDADAIGLSVSYSMDKVTLSAGYSVQDKNWVKQDDKQWYANASYSFTNYVSAYGEIADNNGENNDMGYSTGLRVKF